MSQNLEIGPMFSHKTHILNPTNSRKMDNLSSTIPIMCKTIKIMRRSIYTFLQNYHYFTTVALLALPFSASILISQVISPSLRLLPVIHARLRSVFVAAGFPVQSPESEFFTLLNFKLSQTITYSILVLPFTFSFLLISKAFIIQKIKRVVKPSHYDQQTSISVFNSLFLTQICNSFVILSANATCFWLLFVAFNCFENLEISLSPVSTLIFSSVGAVVYSVILANALIICNLALVVSGMERNNSGFLAILKACFLIRGRSSTALSLAIPINLGLAAIEALFHYRIVNAFSHSGFNLATYSMAFEGLLIAYLYAVLIVMDTIMVSLFYKSCRTERRQEESIYSVYRIEIREEDGSVFANVKSLEELS